MLCFLHCLCNVLLLKAGMGLGLTVPELFVRRVETQATEATLEDMLDTILRARALLHLWHHLLQRHRSIHRK